MLKLFALFFLASFPLSIFIRHSRTWQGLSYNTLNIHFVRIAQPFVYFFFVMYGTSSSSVVNSSTHFLMYLRLAFYSIK
jgi:hypothetical protein